MGSEGEQVNDPSGGGEERSLATRHDLDSGESAGAGESADGVPGGNDHVADYCAFLCTGRQLFNLARQCIGWDGTGWVSKAINANEGMRCLARHPPHELEL